MTSAAGAALSRGSHLLLMRGVQYALVFVGGLVIARALGPDGRGEYALALNFATLVWIASHLSVEAAAARLLGRREADWVDVARGCMAAALVLGTLGAVAAAGIGLAARSSILGGASAPSVLLAAATIPFTIPGQFAAALVFRRGRTVSYGLLQIVVAGVQLTLLVAIEGGAGLTPEWTLAINLFAIAGGTVGLLVLLARELGVAALVPEFGLVLRMIRLGASLHIASITLFLNLRLDLLLVGVMLTTRDAGLYSLSLTLAELVLVATATLGLAALEAQTQLDQASATDFTLDFARQSLAVATCFAVVAALASYPLVVFAYGSEWRSAVAPFAVLTVGAVGLAVESPVRGMLLRVASPWSISAAAAAAAIVNLLLNLLLLPILGIIGAAVASSLSYWLAALLMLLLLRRTTGAAIGRALMWPRQGDLIRRWLGADRGFNRGSKCAD